MPEPQLRSWELPTWAAAPERVATLLTSRGDCDCVRSCYWLAAGHVTENFPDIFSCAAAGEQLVSHHSATDHGR